VKIEKIGVIGAMHQEIALLLRDMTKINEKTFGKEKGARTYCRGNLYGKDATLVFSRWGKVASASTVTTLIDIADVNLIVFTGVAGAISEDLQIGDVVIGNKLVQHDLDARPLCSRYEVPQLEVDHFFVEPEYVALAIRSAERYLGVDLTTEIQSGMIEWNILAEFGITRPKVHAGLIATGDQFIADSVLRDRLKTNLPEALCVEMEGAAVAQVCYERDVPLVVVRTISDKADSHIDFVKFVETVASHFTRGIVREFIAQV
jgi:adenosylhomocysteine nucleosidase